MSDSMSIFHPRRLRRGARVRAPVRVLVLGMAAVLALFLVLAAGHRHERALETHACAVCTVLAGEVPSFDALPPVVQGRRAHAYALAPVRVAYAYAYRQPVLMPPSCGPPVNLAATRVASSAFQ